jgi:hypothetical protein
MIMAVWNCVSIPLEFTFDPDVAHEAWWTALDILTDLIFVLDILVTFRTSYIRGGGKEIIKPYKIALAYIKGRFLLDFLSVFTFHWFSSAKSLTLFGLLKLARIGRLSKIIDNLNMKEDIKMSIKLLKLFFYLVLFVHLTACTWFWIITKSELWWPPLDWMYLESDLYESSKTKQYWSSFYHAVLMLYGNELGPRTEGEMIFVGIVLILGAVINANIFGTMAVILQELSMAEMKFQ